MRRRLAAAALGAFVAANVAALGLAVVLRPLPAPPFDAVRAAWVGSDALLLDRDGVVLDGRRVESRHRRHAWVPLADVSPALLRELVAAEDHRFRAHRGVDWQAVAGALRDRVAGRGRRGASTLTMQVATLLGEASGQRARRDLAGKLAQARVARGLERAWTKDQILEAYVNLVSFRGELQGVGAAAALLAGKSPAGLTAAEAAVLAALLPAPASDAARVARRACARAAALPVQQRTAHCAAVGEAATRLLARRDPPPRERLAPHLANALLRAPGVALRTTLDARVQRATRAALARQLAGLDGRNVRDAAAIVVANDSGDVLAYVGSAGAASRAAAVDGVRALRQAGSTLKPFLYGLALERRYLTAASLLDDTPLALETTAGIYLPRDYDDSYRGKVSLRTALGSSLNVPAVRALVLTGVEPFRDRLRALGYDALVQDGEWYGYSLALGSAEVSLWQQATAWRTLARGGLASPLRLRADDPRGGEVRVLPGAESYIVADMLADRAARAGAFGPGSALDTPYWAAVKTGTSKDMRDNWCVGFTARYTVAVWVGNFEGDAMRGVSGVSGAAPAWREIQDALQADGAAPPPTLPAGVVAQDVRFAGAAEPPRRELFVAGTEPAAGARIEAVTAGAQLVRIQNPVDGMVIALDPDIPRAAQRVPIRVQGARAGLALRLDGQPLGEAAGIVLWEPRPGSHRLSVADAAGRELDRVSFSVR